MIFTAQGRSSVSNTMLHLLVRDAVFQQGGVGKLGGINAQTINHEDTCDNISINVSRIFLGINLECISCHAGKNHLEKSNLYLTGKTREEFWRHTAFFAASPVRLPFHQQSEFSVLDEGAIYDFVAELHRTRRVSDKTYARVHAVLSDIGQRKSGMARELPLYVQIPFVGGWVWIRPLKHIEGSAGRWE